MSCHEKTRVHLSANPSERYLYFDKVYDCLSALDSIEMSFCPCPDDSSNDLPDGVKTLVILTSEKYFTAQNSGYISEYLKAKEKGTEVIPLLFDENIINLLNTRCGKTQYISVGQSLDTALAVLSQRLVSKAPAENSELPQVFISYRKEDRAELNKLLDIMAEFKCRDKFSVWFDGDILPGDRYEQKITSALKKSELFILLVTPNLLKENNFVKRVEYPAARALNKKIIAVEAVKTNRKELSECFPRLSNPVTLKQCGAIEAELLKSLKMTEI